MTSSPAFSALDPLRTAFDSYARIGLSHLPKARRSSRYAFNALCLIGSLAAFGYVVLYFALGLPEIGLSSSLVLLIALCPWIAVRSEGLCGLFGIGIVTLCFSVMTYFAGRESLLHLFIILGLINGVVLWGTRKPLYLGMTLVVTCVAMAFCQIVFTTPALGARITDAFATSLSAANLVATGMMTCAVLYVLSRQVSEAQEALAAEHARSEALLDNLLPAQIAARLKSAPGQVIADDLPAVTILFADIVDFTPRATSMPAEEVVAFLNGAFTEFDKLTARFGLEKIKTIGDAYMVAAGMPVARPDHAEAIADMALAMLDVTARLSRSAAQPIELRIGLHTGSAIAGVIGTQKVFYDVWGDTVNTASRMESHGEVGRIQLTAETRAQLGAPYLFERRGRVEIKGKGAVETFWLTGKAAGDAAVSVS